jgi:hypothetical protein
MKKGSNPPAPKGKRPPGPPAPPRIKQVVVGGQLFTFNQDEIDKRLRQNERNWMRMVGLDLSKGGDDDSGREVGQPVPSTTD